MKIDCSWSQETAVYAQMCLPVWWLHSSPFSPGGQLIPNWRVRAPDPLPWVHPWEPPGDSQYLFLLYQLCGRWGASLVGVLLTLAPTEGGVWILNLQSELGALAVLPCQKPAIEKGIEGSGIESPEYYKNSPFQRAGYLLGQLCSIHSKTEQIPKPSGIGPRLPTHTHTHHTYSHISHTYHIHITHSHKSHILIHTHTYHTHHTLHTYTHKPHTNKNHTFPYITHTHTHSAELTSDELEYLSEGTSKQSVEVLSLFILAKVKCERK